MDLYKVYLIERTGARGSSKRGAHAGLQEKIAGKEEEEKQKEVKRSEKGGEEKKEKEDKKKRDRRRRRLRSSSFKIHNEERS